MFMPADNMQKDFAYQHKFNIYGRVGHTRIHAQGDCVRPIYLIGNGR